MNLTKKELNRIAKEQGFVRDTLEKVCRLTDILAFMNAHPPYEGEAGFERRYGNQFDSIQSAETFCRYRFGLF